MHIRIRTMTRADIDEVLEIERASFSEPWSREAFHATLLLPYAHYYVAELVEGGQSTAGKESIESSSIIESKCGTAQTPPPAVAERAAGTVTSAQTAQIIGECGVRDIMGEGEITNVAIHPAFRGKGFASQMMHHVLEDARRKGMTAFTLEVRAGNRPAIALYERFGFRTEGVRQEFYENPVEDGLIMWLRK